MNMDNISEELILQNNDKWRILLAYNPITGSKRQLIRSDYNIKVNGTYVIDKSKFIAFYRFKGKLFFHTSGKDICLNNNDCTVYHERKGRINEFRIEISKVPVFSRSYRSWRYDPINQADIDFNDDMEENQDFYLFVYNVMKDVERKQRIYNF